MLTPIKCAELFKSSIPWKTGGEDTQYYIRKTNSTGEVLIMFAPSNSKLDWKNNFSFWKRPYKDMEVKFFCHGGFLKCWKLVRDEVEDEVKKLNPKSITVTGWSYGGAIATLCMEDMWYLFPELRGEHLQCITFGAPRVIGFLNYKKIKERWTNTRLFTNGSDIVTCVPFICMMFRHVTQQIHIGKLRHFIDFFKPQIYHDISNYIESIRKIIR